MFSADFLNKIGKYAAIVALATEAVKRILHVTNWVVVVLSLIVSFIACLPELVGGPVNYVIAAITTAVAANGYWKVLQKKA